MRKTEISIIVPVYQGADYLAELLRSVLEVKDQFDASGLPLEISECICVSDSAIDDSINILKSLQDSYPWLRVLPLSRNYGQHPATVAGILHSSGDWIVTLDEDLQHDPKQIIPMLTTACTDSHDIVYAKGSSAIHRSFYRDAASKWVKKLLARLAGCPFLPLFNSFRLVRGSVARAAAAACATETYFDVALTWFTHSVGSLTVDMTDQRTAEGKASNYRFRSLVSHASRLVITSDLRLLRFGAKLGFLGTIVGILLVIAIAAKKLLFPESIPIQGWASTISVLILVNGLISLQCGVAMKYLSLVLQRTQGRPTFFVVDRSNDGALLQTLKTLTTQIQCDGHTPVVR